MGLFGIESMVPMLVLIIYVGFMGIALYLAILLANFLRAGIKAFNHYVDKDK